MSESDALPSGWTEATVGDLAEYINGFAFKPSHWSDEGIPIIRIQNLTNPSKPINRTTFDVPEIYSITRGDLLVSWSATLDAFIWQGETAWLNQHIFKVVAEKKLFHKGLLFYWMKIAIEEMVNTEHLHGSTMKHINRGPFLSHKTKIPPFKEQVRIFEKLEELFSDLDDGVTELKAAQIKLSQYRQSLLKSAVEGSLTADWREKNKVQETGEQLLERILNERREHWEKEKLSEFEAKGKSPPKDWQKKYPEPVQPDTTDLPDLPEGWTWASLDMIGEIVSGVTKGTKRKNPVITREVPYLRVANVQRGYLDLTEIKTIEATEADIERYTLQKNDILFNEGGDRDKLGRGWVWRNEIDGCIHQNHVFRLRLFISEVLPELTSHYANTFGKLWFQHAGKQTTNLASINKGILQSFPIPLAPLEEQRLINEELGEKISQLEAQVEETSSALKLCEAQRKKILQDAFSGKLVAQDPNDESAMELLNKIKAERAKRSTKLQPKRTTRKPSKEAIFMGNLEEVLKNKADWVDAQEAFRECGVKDGTDTVRIEELYAELSKLDKEGRLDVERHGNYDLLRLKVE